MKLILDLSSHNANVVKDWSAIKNAVDGVILRVGYRGYGSGKVVADKKFKEYAEACKRVGLPFGLYFMSQAINAAEGAEEATYIVNMAKQYGATLPLYIDSEDGDGTVKVVRADGLSQRVRTDVVKAFCETVKQSGYVAGVYASESWYNNRLFYEELVNYNIWVADYGKNTGVKNSTIALRKYDVHQYTSKGRINGISAGIDLSEVNTSIAGVANVKSEETYNMKTIKKGSKGNAVKVWQIIVGADPDGIFGNKTDLATREFQKSKGLSVDGIVGKNSWKAGLESL